MNIINLNLNAKCLVNKNPNLIPSEISLFQITESGVLARCCYCFRY